MTEKRVVLHIGLHKTGSSAIQEAFNGYDRGGFVYADLGPINHSYAIRTAFDSPGHRYSLHVAQNRSDAFVARKRRRFRPAFTRLLEGPAQVLIFSGEDISGLDEEGLRDLAGVIEASGRRLDIVCYLRAPVEYASAIVVESLKHGYLPEVAPRPPYYPKLKRFMDVIGRDRLIVRDYRPERFPDGDVVADFAGLIGAPVPQNSGRVNVSLSAEACDVLAAVIGSDLLPAGKAARYRVHRSIHPLLDDFGTRRFRLEADRVEDASVCSSCAWLKREFGIDYACTSSLPVEEAVRTVSFEPPDLQALAAHLGGVTPRDALAELVLRARRRARKDRAKELLGRLARWRATGPLGIRRTGKVHASGT